MITINQGENFLLSLSLQNDDLSNILVSEIQSFDIQAMQNGRVLYDWLWTPKPTSTGGVISNVGNESVKITDGLALLEVSTDITERWSGVVDFEVTAAWIDMDYFVSGAQVDVFTFPALLTVQ